MRSNYDKLRMYFSRNQQIYVFENILTSHNGILLIKEHFYAPTHGIYLVGTHKTESQVCCKKYFPRFLFASLAKEQFYSTFSKYNFNFCIMTAVVPAVFHFLLSFKFGDYGLGR